MSSKLVIMAGLAVVFGASSYFAGNHYLKNEAMRLNSQAVNQPAIEVVKIVVAAKALKFGDKLAEEDLKLVSWPKSALPEGAYTSLAGVLDNGERRAITSIEPNEPLLPIKLTGENGRAGLAGIISEGMRAVTIPVDNVKGVGGFVMPGDRVDIVFTQRDRDSGEQIAKIIMENIKVLSVDQRAGSRADGPKVAKTVTLETDAAGAQKLALATNVGRLSLLLRGAGDENSVGDAVVSFGSSAPAQEGEETPSNKGGILSFLEPGERKTTKIRVVRGEEVNEQSVPVQKALDNKDGRDRQEAP